MCLVSVSCVRLYLLVNFYRTMSIGHAPPSDSAISGPVFASLQSVPVPPAPLSRLLSARPRSPLPSIACGDAAYVSAAMLLLAWSDAMKATSERDASRIAITHMSLY